MGMKSYRVRFFGRVQGVNFRRSTADMARRLGVRGWVMNMPDGSVEALLQGPEERVRELVDYCRTSIRLASVTRVQLEEVEAEEFMDFTVRL
ncbi:acylphosphatase [Thermogymnomonas acidicola]|uniref:acylphosphatase n=1 Tax=Thermogymnomonas acidicola TaxID=399579 RepID=A0AA37BQ18_9ARCH|nr:acylphosphatase [Thermogymnomonas acidicola]